MEKLEEATLKETPIKKKPRGKEPTRSVEPKSATFPVEGTINAYGFIHLNTDLMEAFGISKGAKTPISIDFKDGALIIRKV